MRLEFWGARGSIPCSHPDSIKYGGNTTCVEIRTRSNDQIILDAGSGIRSLGVRMMSNIRGGAELIQLEQLVDFMVEDLMKKVSSERPESLRALEGSLDYKDEINLFNTHFHWDHIQGWPFFVPAFIPGKKINIYGHLKADHRLADVYSEQMSKTYFPVYLDMMASEKNFCELGEDTVRVGDATITSFFLNHPQGCLGYRIVSGEMVIAFATDVEHPEKGLDENMLKLADGADVLIYDCQYTPEEYEQKKNWGHSTWEVGVRIAREAGVRKLIMTHHDPEHNDAFIDGIEAKAREHFPNIMAAYEGLVLTDFPVEPTLDAHEENPDGENLENGPDLKCKNRVISIECGPAMRNLAQPRVREEIESFMLSGAFRAVFDLAAVSYSSRHDLVALADICGFLHSSNIEIEIVGSGKPLLRKLIETRFGTIAAIPRKPFTA